MDRFPYESNIYLLEDEFYRHESKISFAGKSSLLPTRQPAHVHIQNLVLLGIVMLMALTLLPIDCVQQLFHLAHMLSCAAIQRFLHHRLLGALTVPKRCLQCWITA